MILEFLRQPWPWYVAGPLIALTLYLLLYFGKTFGISSTFRTACSIAGAGKASSFFRFNWRSQVWNLVFAAGTILGGWLAFTFLQNPEPIHLNPKTINHLQELGIDQPHGQYLPEALFTWEALASPAAWIILILGGFLVGFGARYAGGCTSGHAITGLSNLQIPSLIAVIGFFIGGLITTYFLLPIILKL